MPDGSQPPPGRHCAECGAGFEAPEPNCPSCGEPWQPPTLEAGDLGRTLDVLQRAYEHGEVTRGDVLATTLAPLKKRSA